MIRFCANNSTRPEVHNKSQFIDGVIGQYDICAQISYQSWFPAVSS